MLITWTVFILLLFAQGIKNYKDAENYLRKLLSIAPDMGRAYQELAHLNRDMGNKIQATGYYRQATEHNPALCFMERTIQISS